MKTHNKELEFQSQHYAGDAVVSTVRKLANVDVNGDFNQENWFSVCRLSKIGSVDQNQTQRVYKPQTGHVANEADISISDPGSIEIIFWKSKYPMNFSSSPSTNVSIIHE